MTWFKPLSNSLLSYDDVLFLACLFHYAICVFLYLCSWFYRLSANSMIMRIQNTYSARGQQRFTIFFTPELFRIASGVWWKVRTCLDHVSQGLVSNILHSWLQAFCKMSFRLPYIYWVVALLIQLREGNILIAGFKQVITWITYGWVSHVVETATTSRLVISLNLILVHTRKETSRAFVPILICFVNVHFLLNIVWIQSE